MNVDDLRDHLETQRSKAYRQAERKLLPAPLVRERVYRGNVFLLVILIYSAPWLYFGFKSFMFLHEGPLSANWSFVWRIGLAVLFGWYHAHASKCATGLFYPLDLWEQSISRRVQEWRDSNPEKTDVLNKLQNPLSYW